LARSRSLQGHGPSPPFAKSQQILPSVGRRQTRPHRVPAPAEVVLTRSCRALMGPSRTKAKRERRAHRTQTSQRSSAQPTAKAEAASCCPTPRRMQALMSTATSWRRAGRRTSQALGTVSMQSLPLELAEGPALSTVRRSPLPPKKRRAESRHCLGPLGLPHPPLQARPSCSARQSLALAMSLPVMRLSCSTRVQRVRLRALQMPAQSRQQPPS
jgi:hypothetical protein